MTVQYNRTVLDANNTYLFVFKTANYVLPVYVDPPEEIEHSSNLHPADRTGGQMEELKWELDCFHNTLNYYSSTTSDKIRTRV